jgi:Ceramidase
MFRRRMATNFADYPNLLKEGCPWVELRQAGGLPNVKWCEETLCSVVAEPANTWSNLAYLLVAVLLFQAARSEKERTLKFFAPAAFWVGITSLVYHATVSFLTQVFDFWGMYIYFLLILFLNLVRFGALKKEQFFKVLWLVVFAFTGLTVAVAKAGLPIQGIVGLLLVSALVTEVLATRRATEKVSHKAFGVAIVFIAVAAAFSASDASRAFCDRESHWIQGHAIWHCLGAVALYFSYHHYTQFKAQFV